MNKNITIGIVVILAVIIGIGTYYFSRPYKKAPASSTQTNNEQKPVIPQAATVNNNNQPITAPSPTASDKIAPAKTYNISAVNFSFNPAALNINKGDTVVWTNQDSAPHQITVGDLNGPVMSKGQIYSFVFNSVGAFNYHCYIHPSMTGTVIVK